MADSVNGYAAFTLAPPDSDVFAADAAGRTLVATMLSTGAAGAGRRIEGAAPEA